MSGEKTAFAYSDDINLAALEAAATATRAIAAAGANGKLPVAQSGKPRKLYAPQDPIASLSDTAKVQLLEKLENYPLLRQMVCEPWFRVAFTLCALAMISMA